MALALIEICQGAEGTDATTCEPAWAELEAAFPHFRVTIAESAQELGFNTLLSAILASSAAPGDSQAVSLQVDLGEWGDDACTEVPCGVPHAAGDSPQSALRMQFPVPLVGDARTLALQLHRQLRLLDTAAEHCLVCPCHGLPAVMCTSVPHCPVSGAGLLQQECTRDPRVLQVGSHPGALLRFDSPFSITSAGQTTVLSVVQRVKVSTLATPAPAAVGTGVNSSARAHWMGGGGGLPPNSG